MGLGFTIGIVGVLILGHATYSTIQYRGLLKIVEDEFSGPPLSVVAELVAGLVLCLWAALTVPGKVLRFREQDNRLAREFGIHDLQSSRQSFSCSTGFEAEALVSAGAPPI